MPKAKVPCILTCFMTTNIQKQRFFHLKNVMRNVVRLATITKGHIMLEYLQRWDRKVDLNLYQLCFNLWASYSFLQATSRCKSHLPGRKDDITQFSHRSYPELIRRAFIEVFQFHSRGVYTQPPGPWFSSQFLGFRYLVVSSSLPARKWEDGEQKLCQDMHVCLSADLLVLIQWLLGTTDCMRLHPKLEAPAKSCNLMMPAASCTAMPWARACNGHCKLLGGMQMGADESLPCKWRNQ